MYNHVILFEFKRLRCLKKTLASGKEVLSNCGLLNESSGSFCNESGKLVIIFMLICLWENIL